MRSHEVHDEPSAGGPRPKVRKGGIAQSYRVAVIAGVAAFLLVLVVITRFWPATGP